MSTISQQAIKAIGRSDVTMKQEIIKKTVGVLIILLTVKISVFAIVIGSAITEIWFFLVNTYPCKTILGYSYIQQLSDLFANALISVIMAVTIYGIGSFLGISWLSLIIQVISGAFIYLLLSYFTKNESFNYIKAILHSKKN